MAYRNLHKTFLVMGFCFLLPYIAYWESILHAIPLDTVVCRFFSFSTHQQKSSLVVLMPSHLPDPYSHEMAIAHIVDKCTVPGSEIKVPNCNITRAYNPVVCMHVCSCKHSPECMQVHDSTCHFTPSVLSMCFAQVSSTGTVTPYAYYFGTIPLKVYDISTVNSRSMQITE